jgi:hypothetical protein
MSFAGPILRRTGARGNGSLITEPTGRGSLASHSRGASGVSAPSNGALIFVAGIAVGALVGVATALLMAPQSGVDTRRALARQSKRLARRSREALEDFGDEFKRQRSAVRRRIASAL